MDRNLKFGLIHWWIMTAPGQSAFNEAERIMSHLNTFINGMVFDAVSFKNPLNSASKTIDDDLERANLEQCVRTLCNALNSKNTEKFILLNPSINYKNTLNSLRLISLIRQLEYCKKNNIEVLILSTKDIDINKSFSYEHLKILSSNEILERHNYGPNIYKKVYSFKTSNDDNKITNSKYIIGPRKVDNLFQYEMNIILSKNINYNDVMDLFSTTIKFSPKKVRNI